MSNPFYCALDRPDTAAALALAERVREAVGGLKLGLELFVGEGPNAVRRLAELGLPLFLDVKLHDIPNTVGAAARELNRLPVAMFTVHAAGGAAMVRAAVAAAEEAGDERVVLAVTVLTSLDEGDLTQMGVPGSVRDQVLRLAELAIEAGAGGLVCSPTEVGALRERFGPGPRLVVPGLRLNQGLHDQKRTATPAEALAAGADILVVGRAITSSPDPALAAQRLLGEAG